jgi:hypothetical protein
MKDEKEKYIGIVKWNGNHYFSGDKVIGESFEKDGKSYIIDEWEDEYGNEFKDTVEVTPLTIELIEGKQ